MNNEVNKLEQNIISRLTVILEVKYIYKSILKTTGNNQLLFIVILKGKSSSLTQELSAMVAKIFQEETDFLYRIFSFEYAKQQLKEENLSFVHGCTWNKLVFHNPDDELDLGYQ